MIKKCILLIIGALALAGCTVTEKRVHEDESDTAVMVPRNLLLTKDEINEFSAKSKNGDCSASYRLYLYYAFCTSEQELAFIYLEKSVQQGCEENRETYLNVLKSRLPSGT